MPLKEIRALLIHLVINTTAKTDLRRGKIQFPDTIVRLSKSDKREARYAARRTGKITQRYERTINPLDNGEVTSLFARLLFPYIRRRYRVDPSEPYKPNTKSK